jgi:hypothetical protein
VRRARTLPQRKRGGTRRAEESGVSDFLEARPEYPAEVALGRALLNLKKVAPDLRGSFARAVKYSCALELAEAITRRPGGPR